MDWTPILYVFWPLVWILGTFLPAELLGHFDKKKGGTFSEWLWLVFCLRKRPEQRYQLLRRWAFTSFWTSLTFHFYFQASHWLLVVYAAPCVACVVYWWRQERGVLR